MTLPLEAYARIYEEDVPWEPWPEPEQGAMATEDFRGKAAVVDLVALARKLGWSVLVTQAKGSWPSVAQRPSVQRWSLAVRMARVNRRAVAVYVEEAGGKTWKWMDLFRWSAGTLPDLDAQIGAFLDGAFGPVHGPTLADAGLGPILGPRRMPPGYLNRIGPIHGPDRPRE